LNIFEKTGAHVIAEGTTAEKLRDNLPQDKLTVGDSGTLATMYDVEGYEVVALRGIHVGPISQYLINLGEIRIFHGGDSGYWRHDEQSADIAFVPTGTARTCAPGVALATVNDLQPKVVVGMHGNNLLMRQFKALLENVSSDIVIIIPKRFELNKVLI
jgi:L-ascorbate metabolism protein UlaG (beta-lactamase superfamily)